VASAAECAAAASAVAQAVVAAPPRNQSVRELRERPPLLLLADEDGDSELLLLGELGRHLVGLAAFGSLKIVVDDMVDHVVCVIADHPAVVYLAGDLSADTRRRWRLGFVLVLLLVVLIVVVLVVVELLIVGGHDRLPVAVPVGVTEVAGAPIWAQF
jgi:hypothetical protein